MMDGFMFGLSVALIGMLVVFAGLVILIISINIISRASTAGEKKAKKAQTAPVSAAPAPVVAAPAVASEGVPAEVIAAITAAIGAVWDNARGGFVVRHVRRVSNAPAWNRAGREEQTYSRF